MEPVKDIEKYCLVVCDQIRWKSAKEFVLKEIENHLIDQRDAYIFDGDDEIMATEKAIVQMGDPVSIGEELDKTHKPKPQWGMLAIVGMMMLIGSIVNYYFSIDFNYESNRYSYSILPHIFAVAVLVACYMIDFRIFGKFPKTIYGVVLFVSFIGLLSKNEVNGRLIWSVSPINIPITSLNLIFPLVYALFIYSMKGKGLKGIIYCGIAYLPFALILCIAPTISGLFFYTIIALIVLCFCISRGWFGCNKRQGVLLVLIPTCITFIAIFIQLITDLGFRGYRFRAFLNPNDDTSGYNFVYIHTQELIKASNFIGEGVLPETFNSFSGLGFLLDYSLILVGFRFGLFVVYLILLLVIMFATIGISKAIKEKSMLGSLITLSVILTFALQSALYIICSYSNAYIGSFSLPFIAKGNEALLINAALVGFMLSVFRTGEVFMDYSKYSRTNEIKINTKRVVYENGKLIVNFK